VSVVYRDAALADAEALSDLARETFVATFGALYPVADLKHYIAHTYGRALQAAEIADASMHHRLADEGGALVGYARAGAYKLPFDSGGRRAFELHRLYVREEVKGTGVAAALMDWTHAVAAAAGAQDLYLGVYQGNSRAQRFYARYGFEIVGEYLFSVGATRDPEYIMRKRLD
jgi:diamine N-acetyltransferase